MSSITGSSASQGGGPSMQSSSQRPMSGAIYSDNSASASGSTIGGAQIRQSQQRREEAAAVAALQIPDSPAPHGYLTSPYGRVADEAHGLLNSQLLSVDEAQWQNAITDDGVAILLSIRDHSEAERLSVAKGRTFIPNCRPIEVLASIHLFSYRLVWDTRMSSGRILQRYDYHSFLFYCVWRGVGPIFNPRDAVGVQDVRCWGPHGERQAMMLPNTERADVVWRSVETPDVPPQDGKVRMRIDLGGYRIEWRPHLNGCEVTFLGDVNLGASIPTYLYKVLSIELPKVVGRLRGSIQRFGVPPYVLDMQGCVVVQTTFYYGETRKTTHRHHARKPGSYSIMIDRQRMFLNGIMPPAVLGAGAHAVSLQEIEDRIIVSVGPACLGQEYIIEIEPRDKELEPDSISGWW